MIERIEIKNVATFDSTGHVMENLGKLNFIFGSNGSGKTTISRVLADSNTYSSCTIEWENNTPLSCRVYNTDFVKENFASLGHMPGIFTLGKDEIETKKKITEIKADLVNITQRQKELETELYGDNQNVGKQAELDTLKESSKEKFWRLKQKYDKSPIRNGLEGFHGSKDKFFNEIIRLHGNNKNTQEDIQGYAQLEGTAAVAFANDFIEVSDIPEISFDDLLKLQRCEILKKRIIGKDDVDIGVLINKLENSDWVKKGIEYLDVSDGLCPFCQRQLSDEFKIQLEEYFDETYQLDITEIETLQKEYKNITEKILQDLYEVLQREDKGISYDKLKLPYEKLKNILEANNRRIEFKVSNASMPVVLDSFEDVACQINDLIKFVNDSIKEHNRIVSHKKEERETLKKQIWRFIVYEMQTEINEYVASKNKLENAIEELGEKLSICKQEKIQKLEELHNEQSKLTSVLPTMQDINDKLQAFGFTSFHLAADIDEHSYKIVRDSGEVANDTLSEGEKNFITFLYFYSLLKGSLDNTGIVTPQVVVIDDPVSSMDSDIMFIVSNLMQNLIWIMMTIENSNIKQLIIETHNVFFYKEVSYLPRLPRGTKKTIRYWIVRKVNKHSTLTNYTDDPIMSTYETLWKDIRDAKVHPELAEQSSLQNVMRRILEYYFNFFGNIELNHLPMQLDSDKRIVARYLLALVNKGSHSYFDDIYYSQPMANGVEICLSVFHDIFVWTKHEAHYNMMMRITEEDENGEAQNAQP